MSFISSGMSHPAWVCGLKRGLWERPNILQKSHPAWVCGLKHGHGERLPFYDESHPAWVCGLKRNHRKVTFIVHSHTLRGCVD